jgi:hypothetical protein
MGIRPHCDFECFTILSQTQSSGRQVLSPDGPWVDATPIPDTFVVNIGELMGKLLFPLTALSEVLLLEKGRIWVWRNHECTDLAQSQ